MKRPLKPILACLAATLLSAPSWAESINVKFNGGDLGATTKYGVFPVEGSRWLKPGGKAQTDFTLTGNAKLTFAASAGWSLGRSGFANPHVMLDGYLDDGTVEGHGTTITVSGLDTATFANYSVLIYMTGDKAPTATKHFLAPTVNGTRYTDGGAGIAVAGEANWGSATAWQAAPQPGVNCLIVKGLTAAEGDNTLTISVPAIAQDARDNGRACNSAIQVVSSEALGFWGEASFVCNFDGSPTPVGWFTGWGGEAPSAYAPTPFGKGFVVKDGAHPWVNFQAKEAFSLALCANIAAVDVSDKPKVLAAFGTKDASHIALVKTAEGTVEVWQGKQKAGALSIADEALKAGFHLFAFGNDANGSFLSVDGKRVSGAALGRPASGFQVGALYGGFIGTETVWGKGIGMEVDELRGYDKALTDDESIVLAKTLPASLSRTLEGEAVWKAENAWGAGVSAPAIGAAAEVNAASDATLTMNAGATLSYFKANGEGKLTFAAEGDNRLTSAVTRIEADVEATEGVATLGETFVASGKTLTVGAMTLPRLEAAGAHFATKGAGTTTLAAMAGAPASVTVGEGSTLALPRNVSQMGWETPYAVGANATLNVNGVYDNISASVALANGATLRNDGADIGDNKRQWTHLAIAEAGAAATVAGNTFGSVNTEYGAQTLTLNGGALKVAMAEGKTFWMANCTARKTAGDAEGDTSEAGTVEVVSGALRLTQGGDYSRANLKLTGGEAVSATAQTFGSLSGTGGTLNLNGQTLSVGALGKADAFSGTLTGAGTLTKVGSGALDLCDADFRLFEGRLALGAGTLVLPAGRETELSEIASGATLTLRLSEAQMVAGYTATLPEGVSAEGVTFAFQDTEGAPLTEGVSGGAYAPTETTAVTWNPTDGWGKETLAADDSVVIDFKEAAGQTCTVPAPAGALKMLAIRGSGTVAFAGNATVAALDVGQGVVSLGGAELTVTASLEGTAALTLTGGKVFMQNAAVLANAYTGALTLAGGEWWWGRASTSPAINAASELPALAESVVIQEGATLALHPWTAGKNENIIDGSTTNKVPFSAPVTLEGGTFHTDDGSYYLKGSVTVKRPSTVRTRWVKGVIVETLAGAANLTWEAKTDSDTGEAWNEIRNAPEYAGTLTLTRTGSGTRTLRLTSSTALQKADVAFADEANKSFFKLTNERTVGTLSGSGVTVTSDGDANRTLHIAKATEAPFAGAITDKVALNIHADAALVLTGTLGTVGGTPQTANYTRPLALNGALAFRSATPTTLTANWSGAGELVVGDGTNPVSIAFSGANGGYSGKSVVREGATLAYSGTGNVPFGKGTIENHGLVRMTQDSTAQIPPMSGTGDLEVAGSAHMAGPLTITGTTSIAAGKTLTLSYTDGDFSQAPSINGPSLALGAGAKVAKDVFGEGITLAPGKTLSGAGTVEAPMAFVAGAMVDASAGAPTLTQTVTLPQEGTVSVKVPAEGHGTALTANGLDVAKFALAEGTARQALTATDTALVVTQLPEGVDASSAAGKAILAAAQRADETNVVRVEGNVNGAALFEGVVTVKDGVATVAYDFGVSRLLVRKEGDVPHLYIAAKVSTDYAEGTAVQVFRDDAPVQAEEAAPEGVPGESGVKWLRVPYTSAEGIRRFKVKAVKAEMP